MPRVIVHTGGDSLTHIERAMSSRPRNVLLVGPTSETEGAFIRLGRYLLTPHHELRPARQHWCPPGAMGTAIVRNVGTLDPHQQWELYRWLDVVRGSVQVVSIATGSLLPLMANGTFLDRLYYRLNTLYMEIPTGVGAAIR